MSESLRVLVIDDNPDDRELALRELQREFPNLRAVQIIDEQGLQAALTAGAFDLVVTDYHLQWTDGVSILHEVKQRHPNCPVIMVTGTGNEEVAVEAMKAGLNDYIVKSPRHYARLRPAARAALDQARQRRARQDAEDRYENLFNGVPVGLYVTTPDGQILDANPTLVAMLKFPDRRSLFSARITDLFVNPEDRRIWQARMDREGVVRDFEAQLRCPDGSTLWVRDHARAVRSGDKVLKYEGALEDITERKRAEETLRHSQKMDAVGQLASGIAHDFNNLLTAIFGYTALAKRLLRHNTAALDAIERAEQAAHQASGITRSLLTFTHESAMEKKTLNLRAVVNDAVRLLRRMLPASIELVVDAPGDAFVQADSTQLQQIILNLAINARDAMMPSGGTLRIGVTTCDGRRRSKGPEARLTVSDTGCGMTPAVQARIFEPFYTTKPRGEGTGLGLAIVHGIARNHGARIDVESRVGRGSTFTLAMPCVSEETMEEVQPPEAPVARGHGETVLLAEDHEYVRAIAASALQSYGYEVVQAADGLRFMEQYAELRSRAKLLIVDMGLPRRGGLDCLREIRAHGDDVPVIAITGTTPDEDELAGDANTVLLRKPFQIPDLARLVSRMIRSHARRERVS